MACVSPIASAMLVKDGLDMAVLPAAQDFVALERAAVRRASDLCVSEWSSEDDSTSEGSTEDELSTPPESPELGLLPATSTSPPTSPEPPVTAPIVPKRNASLALKATHVVIPVTIAGDLCTPRGAATVTGLGLDSRHSKHRRGSESEDEARGRRDSTSSESSDEGTERARGYSNVRPRIEIIQVSFEGDADADAEDEEVHASESKLQAPSRQPVKQLNYTGVTAERRAASTRLLSALGKGSPPRQNQVEGSAASNREGVFIKRASLTARRSLAGSAKACNVPSLDNLTATMGAAGDAASIETPAPSTRSPHPRTPTPGGHSRAASCPSPTLGCQATFGPIHVMVTPPTPRPNGAGGPVYGVVIGSSRNTSTQWGRSTSHSRSKSLDDLSGPPTLAPPAFDMAPGRKRMEEERTRLAAAQAWQMLRAQQEQQRHFQQQGGLVAAGTSPMMPALNMTANPWLMQMQLQNQWQMLEVLSTGAGSSTNPTRPAAAVVTPAWQPMGAPSSSSSSRTSRRDSLENKQERKTAEADKSRWWRSSGSRRGSEPDCPRAGGIAVQPRAYVPPGRRQQTEGVSLVRTQSVGSKPTRAAAGATPSAPSKLSAAGRRRFGEGGDVSKAATATVRGEAGRDMLAVLGRLRPARVTA